MIEGTYHMQGILNKINGWFFISNHGIQKAVQCYIQNDIFVLEKIPPINNYLFSKTIIH